MSKTHLRKPLPLPLGLESLRKLSLPHKLGLLERLYGNSLKSQGIGWVHCANSVLWKLDLTDATQRWIVYGDYQGAAMMNWVRSWLGRGGVVVDSGANVGQMLLYVAPLRNVRVYAFEPLPEAHEWLKECLEMYEVWDVKLVNVGLGDRCRRIEMQCDGPRSTTNLKWYKDKSFPRITIELDTLDQFVAEEQLESIKLWKLDVEGGEYEALKGADETLSRGSIGAILLECNPDNFSKVRTFLQDRNYEIYQIDKSGLSRAHIGDSNKMDFVVLRNTDTSGNR